MKGVSRVRGVKQHLEVGVGVEVEEQRKREVYQQSGERVVCDSEGE